MAMEVVRCPHCQGSEVVKYGTASNGKARYRCQQTEHVWADVYSGVCVSGVFARGEAANCRDDAQWEWGYAIWFCRNFHLRRFALCSPSKRNGAL